MKHRIYPWLIGAGTLALFGGYFFFYLSSIFLTTASKPAFGWNTDAAFLIFLSAVWGMAIIAGLFVAGMGALIFGYLAEEQLGEAAAKAQPTQLSLKQAA